MDAVLAKHPFTSGLSPDHLHRLARCAEMRTIPRDEYLWRQGGLADAVYLIVKGRVTLEISVPLQGPIEIETIAAGDILGWSWYVAPYQWQFDARAASEVSVVVISAAALRNECELDHDFGYAFLQRFVHVIAHRLQAVRLRMLGLAGAKVAV